MKGKFLLLCCFIAVNVSAQNDSTGKAVSNQTNKKKWPGDESALRIFYGQRLINAKTVEVLPKGAMAFTIVHTFGDIAGENGGTYTFFGLDEISDAQIGFQIGLSNRLNILLQHTVGNDKGNAPRHYWEAGLKYQFLKQAPGGSPISLTGFGNIVSCAERIPQDSTGAVIPGFENSYVSDADRLSELFQLMAARRFGNVSLQISGTYLHTNLVIPGDQNDLLSIGAAIRLPVTKSLFIISDYFHSFRTNESKEAWESKGQTPRDVFGIGVEILTAGHVFHLNFTNARNILENRFLPRTTDQWSEGEFRWGFTLTRNFMLFNKK
jgi:hypothetical protein